MHYFPNKVIPCEAWLPKLFKNICLPCEQHADGNLLAKLDRVSPYWCDGKRPHQPQSTCSCEEKFIGAPYADQEKMPLQSVWRQADLSGEPILLNHPGWNNKPGHDVTQTSPASKFSTLLISYCDNHPLRVLRHCLLYKNQASRSNSSVRSAESNTNLPIVVVAKSKDQTPRPNAQAEKEQLNWEGAQYVIRTSFSLQVPPGHRSADILYNILYLCRPFD